MTEPTASSCCVECGAAFEPETAFGRFAAAYERRTATTYPGPRPRWLRQFCTERCRYINHRRRAAHHAGRAGTTRVVPAAVCDEEC